MSELSKDKRTVMTLDAGGTNFVFSAIRGIEEVVDPVVLPSNADNLDDCLKTIQDGFTRVGEMLPEPPVAISFAFPGPADYPGGIIGDLGNLPAFRGGVALGPMLEDRFGLPVFLNNDGDLFAYGEAIAGLLPWVNDRLEQAGSPKRFRNLLGVTLGTGFGGGLVTDGRLYLGDNSSGAEIWIMRSKRNPESFAEEGASIRAVQRVYLKESGQEEDLIPSPKEIYEIALGERDGDRLAAMKAYAELGEVVGDALANAVTLTDALVVIGGGLSGAHRVFMPNLIGEMNGNIKTLDGQYIDRLEVRAFNLEDEADLSLFIRGDAGKVRVPGSERFVAYDPMKRTGVGITRLGTSRATAIGAYAFALANL